MTINQSQLQQLSQFELNPSSQKAALFNLIVYTQESRRTEYFTCLIKQIKNQFPCRIFFIVGAPKDSEDSIKIDILTEPLQNNPNIFCDTIFIDAKGKSISQVPFLLLPYFVSDLPIYLLWGQDPTTENSILPHLLHYATRLIFDSEGVDFLAAFCTLLKRILDTVTIPIIDMNWSRISGWRMIMVETFDTRERLDPLINASTITITYNNAPDPLYFHPETQALYFQAWLASCLGWTYHTSKREQDNLIINYQTGKSEITVFLKPEIPEKKHPEGLLTIIITAKDDYYCKLETTPEGLVNVHASDQYQCALPFTFNLPILESGRILMQELFYQQMSVHYLPALEIMSHIELR